MELLSIEQGRSIRLAGELDMSTAAQLDEVLGTAVEHGGAIMIDLSELTFMDSTGIGAFLRAAVSLRGRGCLILHGEQDRVRRVLDLVRVDGSIPNLHRVLTTSRSTRRTAPIPSTRRSASVRSRRAPTSNQTLLPEPSSSTPHDVAISSRRSRPQPLESVLVSRRSASNGGPGSATSTRTLPSATIRTTISCEGSSSACLTAFETSSDVRSSASATITAGKPDAAPRSRLARGPARPTRAGVEARSGISCVFDLASNPNVVVPRPGRYTRGQRWCSETKRQVTRGGTTPSAGRDDRQDLVRVALELGRSHARDRGEVGPVLATAFGDLGERAVVEHHVRGNAVRVSRACGATPSAGRTARRPGRP